MTYRRCEGAITILFLIKVINKTVFLVTGKFLLENLLLKPENIYALIGDQVDRSKETRSMGHYPT